MNILYLCDEYPPGQHGGIGTSVRLMARQLVKMGHRVIVAGLYTPGYGGPDKFDDEGVKVYRYRWAWDGGWFEHRDRLPVRMGNLLLKYTGVTERDIRRSLTRYHEKLEELITEYQIDIVEMPDYNDYIRHCRAYTPFPKLSVPVIVKMNGSLTYFAREAGRQVPDHIFKMEQTILNQAVAVISASKYTAYKSAAYFSYAKPVEVLYNGIDTYVPAGNIRRNAQQVIFTGTLVRKKGIYQLAQAWNIVNAQMPAARLIILGKGPQQAVIKHLNPEALGSVLFMGHVDTEELYDHLLSSAISVFPSYAEAFSLAPLEAMAFGSAVINSNRTSGPELVDDQVSGLLIDPDNINQIATAILYLLNNKQACVQLAENGNRKVREQFDIGIIAEQHVHFYQRVLR
jgi:glycosyltransferase involved in cell wall biosynthesis